MKSHFLNIDLDDIFDPFFNMVFKALLERLKLQS